VSTTETVPTKRPWPPVWRGLFVGEETWADRFPFTIGAQQALLVLGPPRSGKTTSVVVPNVLIGPGAVVTTSTKTDVVAWTAERRAKRGRTWLFDPSGTIGPRGLTPLRWSPVSGCQDWAVANDRAHALASASRSGGGSYLADHWSERAEALLAPLLHAAALGGKTMASVLRWVLRKDVDEAVELTSGTDGHFLAADTIEGVLTTDARERSGIFSTAANLLAAYRNPAALQATIEPNFDPEAFVRSSDTVYICAPAAEQDLLAPIVIAFLEALRRLTYLRPPVCPPVLFVLDEVANIAPLPQLPSLVAEGGSQGLETVACLQDLSQARARWGPAADGFLTLFGWKMLLPGIADMRTLQLVSALAGDVDVVMRSVTETGNFLTALHTGHPRFSVTRHAERRPRLPIDEVAKIPPGFSLLLGPGTGPALLQLRPVWEDYWEKILDGTWERDVASGKFAR